MVLALLAERAETCDQCGHPMSVCRNPNTARTWQAFSVTCQPSVMAQVEAEANMAAKKRGQLVFTRRTPGVV